MCIVLVTPSTGEAEVKGDHHPLSRRSAAIIDITQIVKSTSKRRLRSEDYELVELRLNQTYTLEIIDC